MVHLGLYCPSETGHLNTMLPLGQMLQKRGHEVTVFGILDAQEKVEVAGLKFQAFAEQDFPSGISDKLFKQLGELTGIPALRFTMTWLLKSAIGFLEDGPDRLKSLGIDALVVDQITPEGGTVADLLGIPFVTLCSALPFDQEAGVPPFFTTWPYQSNRWSYLRNWLVYQAINPFGQPFQRARAAYRRKWQLPPETSSNSVLAIISHQPEAFEFPRKHLPAWFHFTGPYHNQMSRKPVDFPWEQLSDQPFIYASMGTLQNRLTSVFETIALACSKLDVQLVLSLGGSAEPESLPLLPGNPIVVRYAPQLELLQRASLVITHAGMNSALEALTYGVPMIAIPVTNDQPGIAARIAWTGAGKAIALKQLSADKLLNAIKEVMNQPTYKQNALRLQQAIQDSGGVNRAADIVEKVIITSKPVYRCESEL